MRKVSTTVHSQSSCSAHKGGSRPFDFLRGANGALMMTGGAWGAPEETEEGACYAARLLTRLARPPHCRKSSEGLEQSSHQSEISEMPLRFASMMNTRDCWAVTPTLTSQTLQISLRLNRLGHRQHPLRRRGPHQNCVQSRGQ
jgi:hypothetical protein